MTGRCARNHCEMLIQIAIQIFAKGAKCTGMGINQSGPDHAIGGQAKISRTLCIKGADAFANRQCRIMHIDLVIKVFHADHRQEITIPWFVLMGEIRPFAGDSTAGPGIAAGCAE